MKVQYKQGPCKNKVCCPKGDTHTAELQMRTGHSFKRGGDPVEMSDEMGKKLIDDHPGMFAEAKPEKPAAPVAEKPKK